MRPTHRRVRVRRSGTALALLLAGATIPLLASPAQAAGGNFGSQATYGTGSVPQSVAVGDFNADGDPDLAVANQGSSTVSVLLGQPGSGTFGPQATYATGTGPTSVAVGDFNADGDPDLVLTNFNNNSVSVLLGQAGAGTFGSHTTFPTGSSPMAVAVGDFNADGDPDLAVTNRFADTVSVLLGGTAGSFGARTDFPTGVQPVSVAVGDFNADGDPDLAVANESATQPPGSVSVLLGQSGGTFAPHTTYDTGTGPTSVAVGDFNADGDPDLVLTNFNNNSVSVLLGQAGAGTFDAQSTYVTGSAPYAVAVGDFNADDDPDLAVTNQFGNNVSVLPGAAAGSFGARTDYATGNQPVSVAVGDFNGNSDPDLAITNTNANTVSVLLGTLPPGPWFAVTPTSKGYGNQPVGTTSATQTFTVSNPGTTDLTISGASLTGTDQGQYSVAAETCSAQPVAPAGTCTVQVAFAPTSAGAKTATLQFTDNAPGSPHGVALTGTGTGPAVQVSPTSKAYGAQLVGTSSSTQTFTLTNTGNADLATTATLAGTDAGQYTTGTDTCTGQTVAPAGTCTVDVTFTPTSAGAKAAELRFTDAAAGSPHTMALTGTGTAPGFSVTPTTNDYGDQLVGTISGTETFTVANTGTAPLTISDVGLVGADPGQYDETADTCTGQTLAPTATCTVDVGFVPTSTGATTATLRFTHDATTSPDEVPLTGTGTAPGFSVTPNSNGFGTQLVGTASSSQTFTVTNTGSAALTISGAALVGADSDQYTTSADTCTAPIAPNGTCTIDVGFVPTSTGATTATLRFTHDATTSPDDVALSGTGTAPGFSVSPASHGYGDQLTGTAGPAQTFTVTNTGTANLDITSAALAGTHPGQFPVSTDNCSGTSVAPNDTCSVTVAFAPTTHGAKSAVLRFDDDAPGSPHDVALTGAGTAPGFSVTPANRVYGTQQVGSTGGTQTFTVTNTGTADLAISEASLAGADAGQFSMSADDCTGRSISPAGTCTVAVAFAPTTVGAMSATVRFTHDAATSPDSLALTGTGTPAPAADPGGPGTPSPPDRCQGLVPTITGTAAVDVLSGTPGDDVFAALGGDDLIRGLGGDDVVCAGPGEDEVLGGSGADNIQGGAGDDDLRGNQGSDTLNGRTGTDRCAGGAGPDYAVCEVSSSASSNARQHSAQHYVMRLMPAFVH